MSTDDTTQVELISFGYLHSPPPYADVVVDLRDHFRDPHFDPALRHLDATAHEIVTAVAVTPGVHELVRSLAGLAEAYLAGPAGTQVTIAVGCSGGRHRSPVVAGLVRVLLEERGVTTAVGHRDMAKPVIDRRPAGARTGGAR